MPLLFCCKTVTILNKHLPTGQLDVVKFLIDKCHVDVNPVDRWENTPIDDAFKYGHQQIVVFLQRKGAQKGVTIMGN